MSYLEKTKEQLIVELQDLHQVYNSLLADTKKDSVGCIQSKKAVLENEDWYSILYAQSPIAIELYDAAGALYHVNPSCMKLFGITSINEISGFSLFDDPNISEEYKKKLNAGASIRYQEPFDFEKVKRLKLYRTCREGIIWLDVMITPLGISDGKIKGFLIQIQDITEQKRAEQALRLSEEQLRNFYNDAPIGLYRTNPDGKIIMANRAICDMLGFASFEELSARNLEQEGFGPLYSRGFFTGQIEKTGEVKKLESKWISSTGEIVIVQESAKATFDSEGNILYYDGIVEDITGRRRTEEALLETERKYERIVINIQDVVYSVDGESGEFTYLSPVFEKMLGYTLGDIAEMGGRKAFLSQVLPLGKFSEHIDRFSQLRSTASDKEFTDELWWRCKDGSLKCIADHWSPVYQDGRLISTDGVLRDITESKQSEEALNELLVRAEASDRLKTAFMNNISHEVRTPLNGILGFSQIMDDPDLTPEDKAFYKEILQVSSDRLLKTINSYMDISLIVSGNMSVTQAPVNLGDLLNQACDQYRRNAAAKGIILSIDPTDTAGTTMVTSDGEIIRKVLDHLLENAVKFTDYGSVVIGYRFFQDRVEVFVRDTGIGISEELQDLIFDSFLQADLSYTRKHEGSGLGLAIAKGLVELLGGKIWVKSVKGSGSTFGFSIPYAAGPAGNSEQPAIQESQADEDVPLILIAEDDQINILLLETMLRKCRTRVWHVENGRLAVECCRLHPEVSLVLMDLKMPEMDGFEATRLIKSFRSDLTIIAVTAFVMPGDKDRAIAAGCDDYLSKPFNAEKLKSKLSEYIRI